MLKRKKTFALVTACGLLLSLAFGGVAQAQSAIIGVVDEDKLADGYKQYKDAVDKLDQRAQTLDSQVPAREFLNDDEGKQFDALMLKAARSADEQKKLEDMVKMGLDRRAEYTMLVGKATRTDDETKKMKGYQDQVNKNGAAVRKLSDDLLAAVRAQQDTTDADYTNRANTVVGQVAAAKKLVIVVRKRAVVWSADALDITNDVLAQLNK